MSHAVLQNLFDRLREAENQNLVLEARLDRHIKDQPRQPWRQPLGGRSRPPVQWMRVVELGLDAAFPRIVNAKKCDAAGNVTSETLHTLYTLGPAVASSVVLAAQPEGGVNRMTGEGFGNINQPALYQGKPVWWQQVERLPIIRLKRTIAGYRTWDGQTEGVENVTVTTLFTRSVGAEIVAIQATGSSYQDIGPIVFACG